MTKLIKYLKNSLVAVLMIFALLVVQAICDLSLPAYTSKIVNIGIQQGGVENVAPQVITKSSLDKAMLLLTGEDKDYILSKYELQDTKKMDQNKKQALVDKYPIAENELIYLLSTKNNNEIKKLNSIFATPFMLISGIESGSEEIAKIEEQLALQIKSQMLNQHNSINTQGMTVEQISQINQVQTENISKMQQMNLFEILSSIDETARDKIVVQMDSKFSEIPETIALQGATIFTKSEYVKCGIDAAAMQNNYIIFSGLKMLGLALISMIATIAVGFLGARVAAKLGKNLRNKIFGKVVSFSNNEFEKFSTATLITRSTNDIQQIQMLLVMLLRVIFYAPIIAIGGIIKVLGTNTSMAWIIAVAVMVILTVVLVMFATVMPKFKIVQKMVDKVNLVTREILTGLPVIRAFSTEKHEENRFDIANKDLTKTNLFVNRIMSGMMPMMMLVMNIVSLAIVWFGAQSIDAGVMQVGDMIAFIQYTMQIIMSFLMISMVSIMLPRASVSAARVDEIIQTDVVIKDSEQPKKFSDSTKGLIQFKHVSFKYPDAEEEVLSDISFVANPGETTAFIGSTGSGKSTLINLIPRFFDVTSGEIFIDNIDIKDVTQKDLRSKIGYVPQKGVLFSGTIESNIKYGNEKMTDTSMEKAAQVAQASGFIEEKSEKFKSEISQGGTNVSGGQKQRLSIARAVAINPEIYIFDDSFSALDYRTDVSLRKALKEYTSKSTVLIVAQRISTILHAEQIVVLDEGKIVGKGTHSQLMKSCDVYKQIASSQLSKEELENEQ